MGVDFSKGMVRGHGVIVPASVTVEDLTVGDVEAYLHPDTPECDHIATITMPIYFVYGPYVGTTDPVTICVTCHACVHDPPEWAIDDTRFTVDLEEQQP